MPNECITSQLSLLVNKTTYTDVLKGVRFYMPRPFGFYFSCGTCVKKKSFLIFNYDRFNSLRNCGVVELRNWNRLRLSPEKRDDKAGASASLGRQLEPSHFFGSKFLIYNQSVSEGCRHASSYVYFWTHVLCQTFIISIGISSCQRRVYV